MIQQSLGDDKPRVYLIDCPSGKRLFWPILHYRQIKDLAILDKVADRYLSRTQRLKFFLAYRQTNCLSDKDKQLIGEIFIHKARRLKREGQGW